MLLLDYEVVSSPDFSNFYRMDKSGLNFRQVNISKTERMEIDRLKGKSDAIYESKTS